MKTLLQDRGMALLVMKILLMVILMESMEIETQSTQTGPYHKQGEEI
jgi:hypothetical protein